MNKEEIVELFSAIMKEESEKEPEEMDLQLIDLSLAIIFPDYIDTYKKLWVTPKENNETDSPTYEKSSLSGDFS